MTTLEILETARSAKNSLLIPTELKNKALLKIADAIETAEGDILAANALDVEAAKSNLNDVMLDRLTLTHERIAGMARGVREVAELPDPVGRVISETIRPNGLKIQRVSVPIGVVAIIYESRPNVTSDAAALALKSGNISILRGGKEAFRTSYAIVNAMKKGIADAGVNPNVLNFITDTSRDSANQLMTAVGYVDLLIPRGGKGLISACVQNARVPCVETGTGICHAYVDKSANLEKAVNIVNNAKTGRPSVCNAEEVLLVNREIAKDFLPKLKAKLVDERIADGKTPVDLRVDSEAFEIIGGTPAGADDFDTEFLDYILAVKVVGGVDEAIRHIESHSTHHSEAIITEDKENAEKFMTLIDSAAVYVNASTRFTDGGEFGLGCEMGISTQKLHARGPMGLCELTTYKYRIYGEGQIR